MNIPGLLYDSEDADLVVRHNWYVDSQGYARTNIGLPNGRQTAIKLHRLILNAKPGEFVDHVNHDRIDNRRANLRIVTKSQNAQNRRGADRDSTTGRRGVYWISARRKFMAKLKIHGRSIYLGLFSTLTEADSVVRAARRQHMTHSSECIAIKETTDG